MLLRSFTEYVLIEIEFDMDLGFVGSRLVEELYLENHILRRGANSHIRNKLKKEDRGRKMEAQG
jgi:hypothetical protein